MSGNPENGRYGLKHVLLYDPYEGMSEKQIDEARKKVFAEAIHHCQRCEKTFKGEFQYWVEGEIGLFYTSPDTEIILMCPACIDVMKARKMGACSG